LRIGGLPESIVDGKTGLIADDAAGLVEQTTRLVRDDELRERLGSAALERAREFTWDRTAEKTLALLQETAGRPPTGVLSRSRRFPRQAEEPPAETDECAPTAASSAR